MTNNWMSDPAVANIDKAKLEFLQALVFESQTLSKEQMLPFLMSVAKKARTTISLSVMKKSIQLST